MKGKTASDEHSVESHFALHTNEQREIPGTSQNGKITGGEGGTEPRVKKGNKL